MVGNPCYAMVRHYKAITWQPVNRDIPMKVKLSTKLLDKEVRNAITMGKPSYLWDTVTQGFGAYVTPTGKVSWLVQRWVGGKGGKAVRSVIGNASAMTIDDAREMSAKRGVELSEGIDLSARKKATRERIKEELNASTVMECYETWYARHNTGNRYWAELNARVRSSLMALDKGNMSIRDVKKAHIRNLIETKEHKEESPVAARNLFAALRPFFRWCVEQEHITTSPVDGLTPPKPPKSRDRVLSRSEVQLVWNASGKLAYPFKHFFRLLLLTGQRREEVAGMRLEELDLPNALWTIPGSRTKNGKAHIVHLSSLALSAIAEALKHAPKGKTEKVTYVLSTTGDVPIGGFSKAKTALDTKMAELNGIALGLDEPKEVDDWRVHDFRRTITSHLAELGTPTDVADRILNHVTGTREGVKGVYQRYEFLPQRKTALEEWGDHIAALVEPFQPAIG